MRIFKESQSFRQWWAFLIPGAVFLTIFIQLFREQHIFYGDEINFVLLFALTPVVLLTVLIFSLSLNTRIDSSGISVGWSPLKFLHRHYSWNEITQCYVRTYSPLREYGGWGLRAFGKNQAWNVSGKTGIQIVEKSGKKFLIGTRKPNQARQVITRHFNNKTFK
ncbi:MAG TPA: hypothetical protein VIM94_12585 [Salegentibacter sp.]|uniref:hypothetical protein n=1 Tax=Salegentibacter sp. TaxID=1903072 RepID=UPI002F91FF8C